jgi:hypothetical protein
MREAKMSLWCAKYRSLYKTLAEEEGFEPPGPLRAQRFSRPPVSTAHALLRMVIGAETVGAVGVEPTTNGLKGRCSATELRPYRRSQHIT